MMRLCNELCAYVGLTGDPQYLTSTPELHLQVTSNSAGVLDGGEAPVGLLEPLIEYKYL